MKSWKVIISSGLVGRAPPCFPKMPEFQPRHGWIGICLGNTFEWSNVQGLACRIRLAGDHTNGLKFHHRNFVPMVKQRIPSLSVWIAHQRPWPMTETIAFLTYGSKVKKRILRLPVWIADRRPCPRNYCLLHARAITVPPDWNSAQVQHETRALNGQSCRGDSLSD